MAHLNIPIHGVSEPRPKIETVCAIRPRRRHCTGCRGAASPGARSTYREEGRAVAALARHLATIAAPGEVVALLLPNSTEFHVAYFAAVKAWRLQRCSTRSIRCRSSRRCSGDVAPRAVVCTPATRELVIGLARPARQPRGDLPRRRGHGGRAGDGTRGAVRSSAALLPTMSPPCSSAAAPPACPRSWSTRMNGWSPRCAASSTTGRRARAARSGCPSRPSPTSTASCKASLPRSSRAPPSVIPERFKPEHVVELMARAPRHGLRRRAARDLRRRSGGPEPRRSGPLRAPRLPRGRRAHAGRAPRTVAPRDRARRPRRLRHDGDGADQRHATSSPASGRVRSARRFPATRCRSWIWRPATRVLPPGERGEVRVRGPHMMTGYRNRPEETAQTIRDGFIHTGDIGHLDADGFLFITDRKKDVVLRQGLQRLPARGRGSDLRPSEGRRRGGRRRARRAHRGRAAGRLRRAPNGRNGQCGRDLRPLRVAAGRLQVPNRGAGTSANCRMTTNQKLDRVALRREARLRSPGAANSQR